MSSYLFALALLSTNPCLNRHDSSAMARSVTNGRLHRYLIKGQDLPLGLYEPLSLKNLPALRDVLRRMPPLLAVPPSKKGRVRAIGIIVDGAYYASGCVKGGLKRQVKFPFVASLFRKAMISKTPLLRRTYTTWALFYLGVWLGDPTSMDGPGTRLLRALKVLTPKNQHFLKAYIYVERKNRGRYPLQGGKLLNIPKDTTRILLLSIGGYTARIIPWPPKKGARIPKFLRPFIK